VVPSPMVGPPAVNLEFITTYCLPDLSGIDDGLLSRAEEGVYQWRRDLVAVYPLVLRLYNPADAQMQICLDSFCVDTDGS